MLSLALESIPNPAETSPLIILHTSNESDGNNGECADQNPNPNAKCKPRSLDTGRMKERISGKDWRVLTWVVRMSCEERRGKCLQTQRKGLGGAVNRIGRGEESRFADSRRSGAWDRGIGRLERDAGRPGSAYLAGFWAPRAPGERGVGPTFVYVVLCLANRFFRVAFTLELSLSISQCKRERRERASDKLSFMWVFSGSFSMFSELYWTSLSIETCVALAHLWWSITKNRIENQKSFGIVTSIVSAHVCSCCLNGYLGPPYCS